jgi:hypothetical protein
MSKHFSMGAINKRTDKYEYPRIAQKYLCPECKKDVNFCKGQIKQPYFAHKKLNLRVIITINLLKRIRISI